MPGTARTSWVRFIWMLVSDVLNPLFAISFALFVSVGYILNLLMPMTIGLWQALLVPCALIPLVWLSAGAYRRWNSDRKSDSSLTWRVLAPAVVPLLVVAPGIFAIVSSPTVQILSHPDLHFGYINQLRFGSTPLENVFVAGHPANYFWLFHAYLAAIIETTSLRAPYVASIVNVLAVFSSFIWIGRTLVMLKLAKPRTLYLGLLIVFVFCSVNITGILSLLSHVANGAYVPGELRLLLLDGSHKHLHSAMNKLANISTMDLGVALFAAAFYSCLRILSGKIELRSLILISAAGILGLATVQIATVYIVATLLGGLLVYAAICLLRSSSKRASVTAFWQALTRQAPMPAIVIYLLISLTLSIPLLRYNLEISYNTRGHTQFQLFDPTNMAMLLGAFALLLPLFALQSLFVIRKGNRYAIFIQLCGVLGLLLGSGLTITIENQYKGLYFLAIVLSISALYALQNLRNSASILWRFIGRTTTIVLLVLVFARIAYVDYTLLNKDRNSPFAGFGYDGNHIIHSEDGAGRFEAFSWIRDNTPADALVIAPLDSFLFASVLPERQFYVKQAQYTFAMNIRDYDRRANQLNKFYRDDASLDDYGFIRRNMARHFPDRSIFAVVKDTEVSRESMAGRGAELVFEGAGDGANVYRLNPDLESWREFGQY